jgi:hypothetical protein
MDVRPRQLAAGVAVAAAAFLGIGALTAASAQDSGDDTTSTTVEDDSGTATTDDGTSTTDDATGKGQGQREDCPDGERGDRGGRPGGDRSQDQQEEEDATTGS